MFRPFPTENQSPVTDGYLERHQLLKLVRVGKTRAMGDPDFDLLECLERVRRRDEDASRALVLHLWPLVSKLVRAHLPQRETPEDLMQDVFLKVFTRLDQFRGEVPFEHWVSRVCVSTCVDRLRAQQRRPVSCWSDLSEEQQAMLEGLTAQTEQDERSDALAWDVLAQLLESLPPKDRLVIQLLDIEQKSIAEVCETTGWNSGVVRIRAFRARQKLKSMWRKLEPGGMMKEREPERS
jgi:RNA polymerase sigma-70 factor (ECF subfamily)